MFKKAGLISLFILIAALTVILTGGVQRPDSGEPGTPGISALPDVITIMPQQVPLADAASSIAMPVASGTNVKKNAKAEFDVSNTKDGYFMAKYLQQTTKQLRVLVKGPSGTQYQYSLDNTGKYEVYPLSDGNGTYQIGVYENISGSKYAVAHTASIDVKLSSEFAPFTLPNQYVNYSGDSEAVKKAAELMKDTKSVTDKIAAVYKFVIENITYDKVLAANVKSGYLPNVDAVLKSKKGICFDYAALMSAMLRSQGIPSKLVIGYAGDVYHAWINVYSKDVGWINKAIYFDGKTWSLMDPTFVSTGGSGEDVLKYVGNNSNYTAKYVY